MQGKDAYNPDSGYPPLPAQDATPRQAPPPYGDYPPQSGYPHPYPPQGNPGYPEPGNIGYPHPPGPQIHVQGPAGVTTVVPGAVIIQSVVGPEPTRTTCRSCNQEMTTRVDRRSTMKTHLMALLLCVFGCWPCVCVPYCVDSCLDTDHYCSKCGAFVGSYLR